VKEPNGQKCPATDLKELLPDFMSGHLNTSDRERILAHLDICPECQSMIEVMRALSIVDVSTGTLVDDHPSREQLALYYQHKGHSSANEHKLITAHLENCRICKQEVEFLVELERNLVPLRWKGKVVESSGRQFITNLFKSPVLGYAIAILLMYPAFQWITEERIPSDPAPAQVLPDTTFSLREMQRGADSAPIVYRKVSQNFVLVRLPYYAMPTDHRYSFALSGSENANQFALATHADFSVSGQITLLTDLSELKDGAYILHVHEIDFVNPADTAFFDYPFELITR
jgi:Putative zinc-finger